MTPLVWPCPSPDGGDRDEYALTFDHQRTSRILIIPALFDEGHKLRRLAVEVMRRLDAAGVDCILPDLPGTNESVTNLGAQTLDSIGQIAGMGLMGIGGLIAVIGGFMFLVIVVRVLFKRADGVT